MSEVTLNKSIKNKSIKEAGPISEVQRSEAPQSPVRRFFSVLGPGLVTGASDDDPSGIGTYAQAGAQFGFVPLWTALFTFPLMAVVQYICAKIGLVTGHGLSGVLFKHFPRPVLYTAVGGLIIANTLNAGADIGAIAAALHMLVPQIPVAPAIVFTSVSIVMLLMFGSYRMIARVFKWLTLSLFAYVISAFFTHADLRAAFVHTVIPTFNLSSDYLAVLVAILGTTISPYLFFWQSDSEVEQARAQDPTACLHTDRKRFWRARSTKEEMKYATLDVCVGMLFSNLVMYFIIFTTAATLHKAGITHITTAESAASALKPIAGSFASTIFALGLIGTGVLAVPILTGSAAYATSQAVGWKYGLEKRPNQAKKFYTFIAVSTIVGMLINFLGLNPMTALLWTAVINGFIAPPLLVLIMLVATSRKIMGARIITWQTAVVGWLTAALMTFAAVGLVWTSFVH